MSSQQRIVLLMDNREENLIPWSKTLAAEGYTVLQAQTLEAAEDLMRRLYLHMAAMDIRMRDDTSSEDISGILLAENPAYAFLPKIILTSYADPVDLPIRALQQRPDGRHTARTFVPRIKGPVFFLDSVKQVFDSLKINWNLRLEWPQEQLLDEQVLSRFFSPHLSPEELDNRTVELRDIFRKLFLGWDAVFIQGRLWSHREAVCLALSAEAGSKSQHFLVKISTVFDLPVGEDAFDPRQVNGTISVRTLHFSAIAWASEAPHPERFMPFIHFLTTHSSNVVNQAVDRLLRTVLPSYQVACEAQSANYEGYFDLGRADFAQKVQALIKQMQARMIGEFTFEGERIAMRLPGTGDRTWVICPKLWLEWIQNQEVPYLWHCSAAVLEISRIFADQQKQLILVDRQDGKLVPVWHDPALLELSLRLAACSYHKLSHWIEAEEMLNGVQTLSAVQLFSSLEPEVKKCAALIQAIRKAAADSGEGCFKDYLGLLFFLDCKSLVQDELGRQPSLEQLKTKAYCLLLACQFWERLAELEHQAPQNAEAEIPLEFDLDQQEHQAKIRKAWIPLTEREYELAHYLFVHAGETCTREDIARGGFAIEKPGEDDLNNLINTNLDRLRKKIEPDPAHPVFLITIRGKGIKLVTKPQKYI